MTITGRHGLANVGNTCYLNSALQALRYATPFAKYLSGSTWESHQHADRKGGALAADTARLVKALLASGTELVVPTSFVRSFVTFAHEVNDDIRFGAQADAAEAVQILLDGLHTQLSREVRMDITGKASTPDQQELVRSLESWSTYFRKEYSPLIDAFYYQTQITVRCGACRNATTRYEPGSVLKVSIPGGEKQGAPAPTLQECIRSTLASETLEEYSCDACKKKGEAQMDHAISRYPQHFIMSMKRFTNTGAKVRARIPYDENCVDLSAWRAWSSLQSASSARYRVVSTIEHLGGSRGGHYCMRAREGKEWLVYDDGSVSVSDNGGAAGPDTYVLFLERI